MRVGFEKNREAAIGLGEEDEMRASNESRSVIGDHNWNRKKVLFCVQKIGYVSVLYYRGKETTPTRLVGPIGALSTGRIGILTLPPTSRSLTRLLLDFIMSCPCLWSGSQAPRRVFAAARAR